ncbi:MAG: tRNA uridine-5-carboxymethylaminomethyl(34) synthesis GTPase MnmE [Candidatus Omnitrophica bacterium]|nr:tRNA uridine-5-carboxymethylaminomethyl(34) synthesis GTPase MnmE [Candidatus Omnitrophota bacterium]
MSKNIPLYIKDTIAAISTPLGESGIGIVRLSGSKALKIGDRIFFSKKNVKLSKAKAFSIHYGFVQAGKNSPQKKEIIDEVLVSVMRAPFTYTREDMLEINCHGGVVPLKKILTLVIASGARLARPGEFTQRAFLNGRIDLVQAEGVLSIISARTDAALGSAVGHLQGKFSQRINNMRAALLDVIAPIEAGIDFPDEGIDVSTRGKIIRLIGKVSQEVNNFVANADKGIILQNGIRMVISGAANVGKSSLMNALVDYERAIVTHISGTTRDVVEELTNINGLPVRLADTAGIMQTDCMITKESMSRSFLFLEKADLVLFVIDGANKLSKDDIDVAEKLKTKNVIIVINKIDLPSKVDIAVLKKILPKAGLVKISALKQKGIKELKDKISGLFFKGLVSSKDELLVNTLRQKEAMLNCSNHLDSAMDTLKAKGYDECVIFELKQALRALDEVVGEDAGEDILERIFSNFCIGK